MNTTKMRHQHQNRSWRLIMICMLPLLFCGFVCPNSLDSMLEGEWNRTTENPINYQQLEFKRDSIATFSSRGGTIFRYKFYTENELLILVDPNAKDTFYCSIMKLNQDTIVFNGFLENKGFQTYLKNKQ